MGARVSRQHGAKRTFLGGLRDDTRGNALAMMAIALIPISGLAGSAVDTARLYVVKVRLQQACDAGVLAGRKFMTDSAATTLDATATARANTFFANNFTSGWMRTQPAVFTPTKTTDNQVNGTASVVVPMTIMKMFGVADTTINVTCRARFDVADTDVLFVLDTTGSMACAPADSTSTCQTYASNATKIEYTRPSTSGGVAGYAGTKAVYTTEKSNSRIKALREAVLSFYDTFAANADPSTKVRYGFVTYSSSVNAGKAILDKSASYMVGGSGAETQNYQTRRIYDDVVESYTDSANNGKSEADCKDSVRDPVTEKTYFTSTGKASRVRDVWVRSGGRNSPRECRTRTETLIPQWEYRSWPVEVSQLVAGSVITDPTKVRGQTTRWLGCVETNVDTPGQSTFTTSSLPSEIDPDIVPSNTKRWFPQLEDVTYLRNDASSTDRGTDYSDGDDHDDNPGFGVDPYVDDSEDLRDRGFIACGKPVKRLGVMTRTDVYNYLYATDFSPMGGTYHDIGMIWGTRLISPGGLWASDTAAWPGRNAPNRVIVFMTDGDMQPSTASYSMYGREGYDRRVANGDHAFDELKGYHNARFLAACSAAKARNIDVWTVAILDTSTTTELTNCATSTAQALYTNNGAGLSTAFQSIARKLAMLRLTQ